MSLYDYFQPEHPIGCHRPGCTGTLLGWQGRHERNAFLFVWRQGVFAPVDQLVDKEFKIKADLRPQFRLPANAVIRAGGATCDQCPAHARFDIECRTNADGLWVATAFHGKTAVFLIVDDWILCQNYYDAWRKVDGKQLYLCPTCESIVQL
jgi:hypothetical protein